MSDPADLGIAAAGRALRSGSLSAVELLEAVRRRASTTEAGLHAYLTLDAEGAGAAAAEADAALARGEDRGPLHGIPIALKDNIVTRRLETTAGSQILSGWRPPYDATVVSRLREAGAVHLAFSTLQLIPAARLAQRHLQRAPEPETGLRESVWARIPWATAQ